MLKIQGCFLTSAENVKRMGKFICFIYEIRLSNLIALKRCRQLNGPQAERYCAVSCNNLYSLLLKQ